MGENKEEMRMAPLGARRQGSGKLFLSFFRSRSLFLDTRRQLVRCPFLCLFHRRVCKWVGEWKAEMIAARQSSFPRSLFHQFFLVLLMPWWPSECTTYGCTQSQKQLAPAPTAPTAPTALPYVHYNTCYHSESFKLPSSTHDGDRELNAQSLNELLTHFRCLALLPRLFSSAHCTDAARL